MKKIAMRSNLLLLLAAAIWGFAFVAQRIGAQYVGSFTFNGVRFALGSLSLLTVILIMRKKKAAEVHTESSPKSAIPGGIISGCILFGAASLQQMGIVETSAGKAAFITGLYIVLVPVFGVFLKHRIRIFTWIGVAVAVVGLYLLCVTQDFSIADSDLLILGCAFFCTLHILAIDHFARRVDVLKLSLVQFLTCSLLSMGGALLFDKMPFAGLQQAVIPVLYGGIASVGIAFTLQSVGQKHAQPSHAAIILSMETVFANIGGILILGEYLSIRGYIGCILMMTGMLLSQLQDFKKRKAEIIPDFSKNN